MRSEQAIIVDMTKDAHALVLYYLKHLKGTDLNQQFSLNGVELNSAYWITAHLCCVADWIFYTGTGSINPSKPIWLSQFGLGSNPKHVTDIPPFEEVYQYLNDIYNRAYELIMALTEEDLQKDNLCGIGFGNDLSIRKLLYHQIRHEASHAGNLAWLCKINGIKTI